MRADEIYRDVLEEKIRVTSPFVRFVRFDLGSAFRVVAAHDRRHLWQARRVRDEEGFPGA